MSNGLAVTLSSLTFNSVDLQRSDLGVHIDIVSGLNDGLRVRGADTVVPGASGRTARNRKADGRDILLAGWIQGIGATEALRLSSYQDFRDAMEAAFNPTASPQTLTGHAADGTTRTILARTVAVSWDPSPINGVGQIAITLDSAVSDWTVT